MQSRLGYRFSRAELRTQALTHRSAGGTHNERLEFLGDAVLSCVVARALFDQLPDVDEGDLTRLRAHLVCGNALAEIGRMLRLDEVVTVGPGELKSGGFRRGSVLADAVEALFGAIVLEAGFERAREVILALYAERLASLPDLASLKDAKTRLQEWLQARGFPLPEYATLSEEGPPHDRRFTVRCAIRGDRDMSVEAPGRSRRQAEQNAARQMLQELDR